MYPVVLLVIIPLILSGISPDILSESTSAFLDTTKYSFLGFALDFVLVYLQEFFGTFFMSLSDDQYETSQRVSRGINYVFFRNFSSGLSSYFFWNSWKWFLSISSNRKKRLFFLWNPSMNFHLEFFRYMFPFLACFSILHLPPDFLNIFLQGCLQ